MSRQLRSFYISALAITGVGLLGGTFITRAHASAWDKMTIVNVNEPIIAGNKVLDPGTYVWKLLDSPSNRHIVQIYDKDQRHLETTVLALSNYRLHPQGKTQFSFWELRREFRRQFVLGFIQATISDKNFRIRKS
jgi:hypothetical protein